MPDGEARAEKLLAGSRRWGLIDVLVLSGLGGLVVLSFWEVFFEGRVFFFRDFGLFFYPKRWLVTEHIRNFEIPFWNPYSGCGEPLLGTYQVAVFYPLALIYYLLPMPSSFMWYVVAHFLVSGAGMYYMMRAFGVRRIAAGFAAVAWAFSPAFVSTVDNVSFQNSLSWLPWCVGFTRKLLLGGRYGSFLGLVVTFAMCVLAGGPEPVVFTGVITVSYAVVFYLGDAGKSGWKKAAGRPLLVVAGLATAVMLSGVELAPFVNALRVSARPDLSESQAALWSAKPSDAVLWLLPRFGLFADRGGIYWRSQYWLKTVYLGAAVPVLALWGLAAARRRRSFFFAGVAAVSMVLAVGSATPVWGILYEHLPGFSLVRYPVKFYLPGAFAMAALAGLGVEGAIVSARSGRWKRLGTLLVVLVAGAVVFGVWRLTGAATPAVDGTLEAQRAAMQAEATSWSLGRSAVCFAGMAAALGVAAFFAGKRIRRPYGGMALAAALFLDIGIFGAHLNPLAGGQIYTEEPAHLAAAPSGEGAGRLYMTPRLFKYLRAARTAKVQDLASLQEFVALVAGRGNAQGRGLLSWMRRTSAPEFGSLGELDRWLKGTSSGQFLSELEYETARENFYPNTNLMWGVSTVESFEPLVVRWHYELTDMARKGKLSAGRGGYLPRLWGATNVVDFGGKPPGPGYFLMKQPGERAFLADRFLSCESDDKVRDLVADSEIDLTRSVALSGEDAAAAARHLGEAAEGEAAKGDERPGTAQVVVDTGNRLVIAVEAERKALLYVADNWYPSMHATVDGKDTRIMRANYSYRAVAVEAGGHDVVFEYGAGELYVGLALTAAGVLALLVAGRLWGETEGVGLSRGM